MLFIGRPHTVGIIIPAEDPESLQALLLPQPRCVRLSSYECTFNSCPFFLPGRFAMGIHVLVKMKPLVLQKHLGSQSSVVPWPSSTMVAVMLALLLSGMGCDFLKQVKSR